MLRLHVEADWLQLAQARTPDVVRVVDAMRGLNWLQGGYRPWRVTLTHDLFRRKPAESCANPTRSEASKTLFDPEIKGGKKAKSTGFKKALEEREDWIDQPRSSHNSTNTLAVSEGCKKAMRLLSAPFLGPEMTR